MTRDDWMQNFGENLQEMLDERGINQRELSKLTGIPTSTISNYIVGKSMISGEAIVKIVYAIDADYFDLLDFGDNIE